MKNVKVIVSKTDTEIIEHWGYSYKAVKPLRGRKFLRVYTIDQNGMKMAFSETEIKDDDFLEACKMLGV